MKPLVLFLLFSFGLQLNANVRRPYLSADLSPDQRTVLDASRKMEAGHYGAALADLEMLKPRLSWSHEFQYLYGHCLKEVGRTEEAESEFKQVLNAPEAIMPSAEFSRVVAKTRIQLGLMRYDAQRWEEAAEEFKEAEILDSTQWVASKLAGMIFLKQLHNPAAALEEFRRSLQTHPDEDEVREAAATCCTDLGKAAKAGGDLAMARSYFQGALKFRPGWQPAQHELARLDRPKRHRPAATAAGDNTSLASASSRPPIAVPPEKLAAFDTALQEADVPAVDRLLKEEPNLARAPDISGRLPLWRATSGPVVEALLAAGADATEVASDGSTALFPASSRDDPGVAAALVAHKVDLNARNNAGQTAVHAAVTFFSGPTASIEWLLQHGAVVDTWDKAQRTPLMLAASAGVTELAEVLVAYGADATAADAAGATPADLALKGGFTELAERLRAVAQLGRQPVSALEKAIQAGNATEVRRMIGAAPLLAHAHFVGGDTALTAAAGKGANEIVQLLLEAKVPVNEPRNDGTTPLLAAVDNRKEDTVRLLLAAKANVALRNANGQCPVLSAAGNSAGTPCLKLLLEAGAEAEVADGIATAIGYAAAEGVPENIELLLAHGAKSDTPSPQDGRSPLCDTSVAVAEILLKHGARVNGDGKAETPLHSKVAQQHLEMVNFLLDHGADPNRLDANKKTPLDLANENAKDATDDAAVTAKAIIAALTAHGAKPGTP